MEIKLSGFVQDQKIVMRKTPDGKHITSFTLKVKRDNRECPEVLKGEYDLFKIVCWSGLAKYAVSQLHEGTFIEVDGELFLGKRVVKDHIVVSDGVKKKISVPYMEVNAHHIEKVFDRT